MKLKVRFEAEEETPLREPEITPEQQLALLQCPQCGEWFQDASDRSGEACPECFAGWKKPSCGLAKNDLRRG